MVRPTVHPWEIWFSKPTSTLVCGVDFHCEPWSMATQIRTKASKLGIKVRISLKRDVLHLLVLPKET